MWLLSSVAPLVPEKVLDQSEALGTLGAFVWFLRCMGDLVPKQRVAPVEAFPTLQAPI